ncbi:hypothetical protein K439DRAFT_678448 [Ramaria rubella]|nr:hypothetical protein K439DRAFT_678448 [Ramaria rubella]
MDVVRSLGREKGKEVDVIVVATYHPDYLTTPTQRERFPSKLPPRHTTTSPQVSTIPRHSPTHKPLPRVWQTHSQLKRQHTGCARRVHTTTIFPPDPTVQRKETDRLDYR